MKTNRTLKNKLPKHKAPDNVWGNIAETLDDIDSQDIDYQLKIKLLTHNAPDIFNNIQGKKAKKHKFNPYKIAASIAIILSLSVGVTNHIVKNKATIAYSIELTSNNQENTTIIDLSANTEFNYILAQNCKIQPKVCNKPEYENLQNQLIDIEKEIENLKQALSTYKDQNIEKHLFRLINDKVKLEKYLLNLFS